MPVRNNPSVHCSGQQNEPNLEQGAEISLGMNLRLSEHFTGRGCICGDGRKP